MNKFKKELLQYRKFKETHVFEYKQIIINEDVLFLGEEIIKNNGETISESENFINAGYNLKNPTSRLLSNLFPYKFKYKGMKFGSIEGFFQGIKFLDKKQQRKVFKMSGIDSCYIKSASGYDWTKNQTIYFQGKPIIRDSEEYASLVEEIYISALQNPFFRQVLKNVKKDIIHSIGVEDKKMTVFTRYEFERELNCLKDFVQERDKNGF